jgi:AraC-like DNA-binding protein
VFEEYGYRLVVNRSGEIITDNTYETLGGAKVAFLKFNHLMAFFDADRPKWSHAYVPDKEWLEKRVKGKSKRKFILGEQKFFLDSRKSGMKKIQGKKITDNKKRCSINRNPRISDRAIEIIYNYNPLDIGNLSVNLVAQKLCVSRSNLYRKFKKETGLNLGNIVLEQKMIVSEAFLINNPELPVKKIAEIVNYHSVWFFIKTFKRFFGITPGRFRHRFNTIISQINEKI